MRLVAALLATACLAAAAAAAQPMEITARYGITNSGMTIGSVRETFVRRGDSYSIQSVTRSEGMLKMFVDDQITVESTGRVGLEGLQPLAYNEHREKDSKRDLRSEFDWAKGVMRTLLHGENTEVALPAETQDRISMMYQFVNMKAFGDTLVVPMADRRKVELFTYKLVDEGTIATPLGEFATRHYQRVVNNPKDTRADVWLAKDRYNFPVRIVLDDPKGFRLDQTIEALDTR
ncbi:MAG TPA: DUF3108 domain-containing protein [Usitatibacter sp.]|nr:DUF3108 domain-containing protein [Usitatibacter sp.]